MERNSLCIILEVPVTATKEECKKAFHRLAHIHHPDKQGGNIEKFKKINTAYQELMRMPEYSAPVRMQGVDFGGVTMGGFTMHVTYAYTGNGFVDIYAQQQQQANDRQAKARQASVDDFVNSAYRNMGL